MIKGRLLLPVIAIALLFAVWSGGAAFHLATYDLAVIQPEVTIYGAEGGVSLGDGLGSGLATGDFNGDGIDDLLVGAYLADGPSNARADAGEAYVVFGSASLSGTHDLATTPPDVTIYGATPNDNIGNGLGTGSLAAGDVNADGIDDVILATGLGDGPGNARTNAGEAYVIFGAASLTGDLDLAAGAAGLVVYGAEAEDRMGAAAAADVNGDGVDDLLLGAIFADGPANGRLNAGEVYLILGGASLSGTKDLSIAPPDVTVLGVDDGDSLSAVSAGDVNDDGIADMILGAGGADGAANGRSGAGEVYVLFGSGSPAATIDLATSPQNVTVIGADSGDGIALSHSGDVNGDGIDDLLVAAAFGDGPANNEASAGEVHVIFGSASLSGTKDLAASGQDFTVFGAEAGDQAGLPFAAADVNADGVIDMLIGATPADGPLNGRSSAGEVYIVHSSPSLGGSQDLGVSPANLTVIGERADDLLGAALASGDFNDDGAADLAAGARGGDGPANGRNAAGEAYIFFGESADQCPGAPEDEDGFEDNDGCPDPDNDLDGICDSGQTSVSCAGSDFGQACFDPAGTLSCPSIDCRNVAEDVDAFKDSDGCPEPDNDNDGFPDGTDDCPGTDSQTGPDLMLGSPQDLNHNGISDGGEETLTSDDVTLTFEDDDGVLDTDGCHDSPGEDFDGDGFTDDAEALAIGTDAGYPCGADGWPADLQANNRLDIGDMNSFLFPLRDLNGNTIPGEPGPPPGGDDNGEGVFNKFNHPVPDANDPGIERWNLQVNTEIDIGDLNALNPAVIAPTSRPPMFGGLPAFFTDVGNGVGGCPYPP